MAQLSLLECCQEAMKGTGFTVPSAILAGDDGGKQLGAIANTAGLYVSEQGDWEALQQEGNWDATGVALQFTIEASFPDMRKFVEDTLWNRTQQIKVRGGSISPQAWQRIQATSIAPTTIYARIRGGQFLMAGNFSSGDDMYFEYITRRWVSNAAGSSFTKRFATDTDKPRFDDELLIRELRWRFRQVKGIEYAEEMRDSHEYIKQQLANQMPHEILNLSPGYRNETLDGFIPEGNWNL